MTASPHGSPSCSTPWGRALPDRPRSGHPGLRGRPRRTARQLPLADLRPRSRRARRGRRVRAALGVGGTAIGTLDLYCDRAGGLSEPDLRTALWVRDAMTDALTGLRPTGEEGDVASWVHGSQADHTEVHQAVGMVMVQLDVDPEQALDRMRARAFAEGRTVTQVARKVLARKIRFQ
ncbi:ANTAR domain-containing protein [Streptomyces diastatochromogenes]|nr:ANTAR domain-containing protein [Streptomyces diastatochromogenes]